MNCFERAGLGRRRALWIALAVTALAGAVIAIRSASKSTSTLPTPRCPEGMRPIAGGEFRLSGAAEVEVASFCLETTEVSVDAYAKCVAAGGCESPRNDEPTCNFGRLGKGSHPINCVNWKQARAYCSWLGRRLPTEREWEYAAGGGAEERAYPWGDELATDRLACWNRARAQAGTCPVKEHPEFAHGLRDMAGNVSEWVEDQDAKAALRVAIHDEPIRSEHRITRGGSWSVADPMLLQGKLRTFRDPGFQRSNVGMRCGLPPQASAVENDQ